jgi:hypothetical protein
MQDRGIGNTKAFTAASSRSRAPRISAARPPPCIPWYFSVSGPAPLFLPALSLTACFPAPTSDRDPDAVADQGAEGQADSGDTAGTGT